MPTHALEEIQKDEHVTTARIFSSCGQSSLFLGVWRVWQECQTPQRSGPYLLSQPCLGRDLSQWNE